MRLKYRTAVVVLAVVAFSPSAALSDDEDKARHQFLQGKAALRQGKLESAAAAFTRAIELDATEVGALRNLARIRAKQGQWDKAIDTYKAYLELVPTAPDAFAIEEAIKHCRNSRRRALLEADGTYDDGMKLDLPEGLVPGSDQAAEEARRRYDQGRARNDNSDQELRRYREAVALDPALAEAWYNLGILHLARGEPDKAVAAHRKYAALVPDSHDGYFLLGVDFQKLGRLAEAEQAYRKALSRDPAHFDSLNNLAVVLEARGRYDGAITSYKVAIEAGRGAASLRARYNLGDLYLERGLVSQAVDALKAVLAAAYAGAPHGAINRDGPVSARLAAATHNALGKAYEAQGRQSEALHQYASALAVDAKYKPARKNLLRVRALAR